MSDWRGLHTINSNWRFGQLTARGCPGYQPRKEWNIPRILLIAFALIIVVAMCGRWL